MRIDEGFILSNLEGFEAVTVSTNKIYRFSDGNSGYILKVNNESAGALSPFWWGIRAIFGSTFETQRENIEDTLLLLENPHIPVPGFVLKSHKHKFQVFCDAGGIAHAPDAFPRGDGLAFQLGQFIGCVHSKDYGYYGHQTRRFRSGFKGKMLRAMGAIIQRHWADSQDVQALFETIRHRELSPASYSLIMPDISANQFVYGEGFQSIKAVVDFDAYVIGPREWELCVIEMCLEDCGAFQRGYEQYGPLPDIGHCRDFYRFFMYLCDPWEKQDLDSFMGRHIRF